MTDQPSGRERESAQTREDLREHLNAAPPRDNRKAYDHWFDRAEELFAYLRPLKSTRTRGDARRSLLTEVRKDIRTLVAKIPPLQDDKQAEDEWLKTLRLLLTRYDLVKEPK